MSESYNKLISTLQTIFEMDKADLDFGIYRIMNQKRDEINRFLEQDLLPQVKQAFADYSNDGNQGAQAELDKLIQTLSDAGMDPELRQQLASVVDVTALENDVFSKLHTFFSRYYDKGDFISQRRYKADTYAIPYEGEEVKLYWANHDQYYIKSSEHLRDYAFIAKDAQDNDKPVRIKLVEADTEKDNVKAKSGEERRFVIDEKTPLSIEDGELLIHFNFIPVGKKKQNDLNKAAVETIFEQTAAEFSDWLDLLKTLAPTEKDTKRTILEKHLNDYTARNTFDYFIHKDLGGFLNRELDFYIKNEVMHLDDIDDASFELTQQQLRKIKILRSISQKIIRMLAQIEDFQKKLWLKKKFVIEVNYCITLDRISDSLYSEIAINKKQISQWVALGFISEGVAVTNSYLSENKELLVDTKYFDSVQKNKILSSIENIDDQCDGVLINSENFQALNLLNSKYQQRIQSIYTDPPYNTSLSEIIYKNEYKHSSWLSLISQRVNLARSLLVNDGNVCITIDDYELPYLESILHSIFGAENHHATAPIRSKPQGRPSSSGFSVNHEYAIFYGNSSDSEIGRLPRTGSKQDRYPERDEKGIFAWSNFRKSGGDSHRVDRQKSYYPMYVKGDELRIPSMSWVEDGRYWEVLESCDVNEEEVWPIDDDGKERVWTLGSERAVRDISDLEVKRSDKGIQISRKYRPNQSGALPGTWWDNSSYSASESGTKVLQNILGSSREFSYPKSIHATVDCLRVTNLDSEDICLDFFAGSGTTAQAVIDLNREDQGRRKYILVEMGKHFDTALKPRIERVIYSKDWKDGKPVLSGNSGANSISHCFKYIRLESYEDALNNLVLQVGTGAQRKLVNGERTLKEDYMLGYWLDVETADSPSLLNIDQFEDPFNYKLNIGSGSVGATTPTNVDLVETFNYLIGLTVKTMDVIRGFKIVTGTNPKDETVLVVWRKLKEKDNAALEEFLDKQGYNPRDTEFEHIYVNGDHTLEDPQSKVKMTEIEFKRLMFDVKDV